MLQLLVRWWRGSARRARREMGERRQRRRSGLCARPCVACHSRRVNTKEHLLCQISCKQAASILKSPLIERVFNSTYTWALTYEKKPWFLFAKVLYTVIFTKKKITRGLWLWEFVSGLFPLLQSLQLSSDFFFFFDIVNILTFGNLCQVSFLFCEAWSWAVSLLWCSCRHKSSSSVYSVCVCVCVHTRIVSLLWCSPSSVYSVCVCVCVCVCTYTYSEFPLMLLQAQILLLSIQRLDLFYFTLLQYSSHTLLHAYLGLKIHYTHTIFCTHLTTHTLKQTLQNTLYITHFATRTFPQTLYNTHFTKNIFLHTLYYKTLLHTLYYTLYSL